ncbi:MAG: IS3 family transposase [Centipeda sp. (in: firmicutes)]
MDNIEEYIACCNERRIKKPLGWLSSAQYRRKFQAAQQKAQEIAFLRFQV